MLEKYHAKMFIPVIKRFFPSLDLASMLAEVDDAIKWHNALLDINKMLEKALMEDHEGGFVSECYCEGLKYDDSLSQAYAETPDNGPSDITEISEDRRISSSSESLSSGDDGQREINIDARVDDEVPEPVFRTENTSSLPDSGYETKVQGHVGVEWPDDTSDW